MSSFGGKQCPSVPLLPYSKDEWNFGESMSICLLNYVALTDTDSNCRQ